jgi:hypothetical protein
MLLLLLLLLLSGPRYRAIFGNLPEFKKYGSHEFMVACRAKYGPVFKVGSHGWPAAAHSRQARSSASTHKQCVQKQL